ncbi:MAG: holo-ACP synthase [Acidimicrobiales bacterium]|jgi:holo-[acyl-carrier protein] synthase
MSDMVSGTLRIGLDVVAVDDVANSVQRFGDRYVQRIFTSHEIACCRREGRGGAGAPQYAMDSLAARFAAKEAVIKVLRPVEVQPEWRSIELHRMRGGWCEIHLSGLAADLAVEAGIDEFSVSVSHEATFAAAVVVGRCTHGDRTDTQRGER